MNGVFAIEGERRGSGTEVGERRGEGLGCGGVAKGRMAAEHGAGFAADIFGDGHCCLEVG
jgi:hypothetical protein